MSRIFDSLLISKFRGLQDIELSDLGQVNILVGPNNSGKTSVVEALSLLCKPFDPLGWMTVAQWRLGRRLGSVYPRLEAIKWLFPQRANVSFGGQAQEIKLSTAGPSSIQLIARGVEIQGEDFGRPTRNLVRDAISLSESGYAVNGVQLTVEIRRIAAHKGQQPLPMPDAEESLTFDFWDNERIVSPATKRSTLVKCTALSPSYSAMEALSTLRLSRVIKEKSKAQALEAVRWLDPGVKDFVILTSSHNNSTLYIEHETVGLAPFYTFGDGLKRAILIALTLPSARRGVLLIDEIETAIHISAFSRIFSWLVKACKEWDIQLFATTHSLEAIDAMIGEAADTESVVAFRLGDQGTVPQRFSGDLLHRLRYERGLDVR